MNLFGLRVIDFHSHFPSSRGRVSWRRRLIERYGERKADIILENSRKYRDYWRHMWGFEYPEERVHSEGDQAERWRKDLEAKGISHVNFVTGGGNDNLAEVVNLYPDQFSGFAHHDPWMEGAPEELERAVKDLGLSGYKMIGSSQELPVDDKKLYPLWEKVEELKVPVVIHFGVLGGGGGPARDLRNMNPLTLWSVASDFPTIPFIIPHFGACYIRELLQLCWSCPNVMIDTSGSNQWTRWMPYQLDLEDLFRKAIETIGPDRLIFGTDSSYFPRGFSEPYLREQLKACYGIGLNQEDIEKIFHKNAERLLKL